jgi:hypothetical protein
MKIKVNKCNCGLIFEDEKEYELHLAKERALEDLAEQFPEVKDKNCDFANGEFSIQRDKDYLDRYKKEVIRIVKVFNNGGKYEPISYGWFRCLDDGSSMFYTVACRILNICPICYKEWGQQYHANNCKH